MQCSAYPFSAVKTIDLSTSCCAHRINSRHVLCCPFTVSFVHRSVCCRLHPILFSVVCASVACSRASIRSTSIPVSTIFALKEFITWFILIRWCVVASTVLPSYHHRTGIVNFPASRLPSPIAAMNTPNAHVPALPTPLHPDRLYATATASDWKFVSSAATASYKTANTTTPYDYDTLYTLYQAFDPPKFHCAPSVGLPRAPRAVVPSSSNARFRVFPRPLICLPHPSISESRRCRTRYRIALMCVLITNQLIVSLNELSRSFQCAHSLLSSSHGSVLASRGSHYQPHHSVPLYSTPPNSAPAAFDPSSTAMDAISNICRRLLAIGTDYVESIIKTGSRLRASCVSVSGVGSVPLNHPSVVELLTGSPLRTLLLSRSKRFASGASSDSFRGSQSYYQCSPSTAFDGTHAPPFSLLPAAIPSQLSSASNRSVGSRAARGMSSSHVEDGYASVPVTIHSSLRLPPLHQSPLPPPPPITITTLFAAGPSYSRDQRVSAPITPISSFVRSSAGSNVVASNVGIDTALRLAVSVPSSISTSLSSVPVTTSLTSTAAPPFYCSHHDPLNNNSITGNLQSAAAARNAGPHIQSSGVSTVSDRVDCIEFDGACGDVSMDQWLFESLPAAFMPSVGGSPLPFTRSYSKSASVRLVADLVSLPALAGTVSLTSNLPTVYATKYSNSSQLLADVATGAAPADQTKLFGPPRVHGCDRTQYIALLKRMQGCNMAAFTRHPKCVNGMFAVPKDGGTQRVVVDARYANILFKKPDRVTLATPDVIAELVVNASDTLYVGKCDLSDFYHALALPEWLMPYFCLPSVSCAELGLPGDGFVYPMLRTLPMGFSHAVLLAQLVHENVIASAGLYADAAPVARLASPLVAGGVGLGRILTYIDDVIFFGTHQRTVERVQDRYESCVADHGFNSKQSKRVRPTSNPVDCLGASVHGARRVVRVDPSELARIVSDTVNFAMQPLCSGHQLSRIVGAWTWVFLINRSALSIFSAVYQFIATAGDRSIPLWRSVLHELAVTADIAPLLFTSLASPVLGDMMCTDSSDAGLGVVVARVQPEIVRPLASSTISAHLLALDARRIPLLIPSIGASVEPDLLYLADRGVYPDANHYQPSPPFALYFPGMPRYLPCLASCPITEQHMSSPSLLDTCRDSALSLVLDPNFTALYNDIASRHWRTVVSSDWVYCAGEHINAKEIRAVESGLRWMLFNRNADALDSRFLSFTDSAVTLFALTKGRSSSPVILRRTRAVAALLFATGMRPFYRFISTDRNPADGPSRRHASVATASYRPLSSVVS